MFDTCLIFVSSANAGKDVQLRRIDKLWLVVNPIPSRLFGVPGPGRGIQIPSLYKSENIDAICKLEG